MKQWKRMLALFFALTLLLTACSGEREKSLSVHCAAEPGEYRPGDQVRVHVQVENAGRKFTYVGADIDQFGDATLIHVDSGNSIIWRKTVSTTDATTRQFRRGALLSYTYCWDIPEDAAPGQYDLSFWIFGQKEQVAGAVTILPADTTADVPADQTGASALTVLSAAWKQQVENDWYTTTGTDLGDWENVVEDTEGIRYYGTYGGYDILFRPTWDDAITTLEVENVTFEHRIGFEIFAYRDGGFTPIQELSAQGKLTRGNLVELVSIHRSYGKTSLGDRTPVLTADTLGMMKVAFLKAYNLTEKYTLAQLSVVYYGQYGDAHVGFINCDGMAYTQALTTDNIDGVVFRYNTGQKLQVVCGGQLLSLREAYEQGLLTREDLVAIRNDLNPQQDNSVSK